MKKSFAVLGLLVVALVANPFLPVASGILPYTKHIVVGATYTGTGESSSTNAASGTFFLTKTLTLHPTSVSYGKFKANLTIAPLSGTPEPTKVVAGIQIGDRVEMVGEDFTASGRLIFNPQISSTTWQIEGVWHDIDPNYSKPRVGWFILKNP